MMPDILCVYCQFVRGFEDNIIRQTTFFWVKQIFLLYPMLISSSLIGKMAGGQFRMSHSNVIPH